MADPWYSQAVLNASEKCIAFPAPLPLLGREGMAPPWRPCKGRKRKTTGEAWMGRDLQKESLVGSGAGPAGDKVLRLLALTSSQGHGHFTCGHGHFTCGQVLSVLTGQLHALNMGERGLMTEMDLVTAQTPS